MSLAKEFKINQLVTVKLENGKTNIYVKKELFRQCRHLLINIPLGKIDDFNKINSIDELAEMEEPIEETEITPEEKFWGHCSNIQAWVENEYDTRILHSELAFPLLKKLMIEGDPIAKKVFKKEIMKRIMSGNYSIIFYLYIKKHIEYLTDEERSTLFLEFKEKIISESEIKKSIDVEFLNSLEFLATEYDIQIIKDVIIYTYKRGDTYIIRDIEYNYKTLIEFFFNEYFFRYLTTNELFELLFNSQSPITERFKNIIDTTGMSVENYRSLLEIIKNKNDVLIHSFIECIIFDCSPLNDYSIHDLRWEYIKYVHDCLRDIKIEARKEMT